MARIKSAIKNIRQNRRNNVINRARRSRLRTQIKKLREHLEKGEAAAAGGALGATLSLIDRAWRKGTLHRNAAARYKSRLSRRVNALQKSS